MVSAKLLGRAARSCCPMDSLVNSLTSKRNGFWSTRSGQSLIRNVDSIFSSLSGCIKYSDGKLSFATDATQSKSNVGPGPDWLSITEIHGRGASCSLDIMLPNEVKLVEVGARDGLQNEAVFVPTDVKVELIHRLADAGMPCIETTSFVSPKWVPQMGDNEAVVKRLTKLPGVSYPALIPNVKGYEQARACGVDEIAIFTTASESFCKKNTNCDVATSLKRCEEVVQLALEDGVKVRGYVSCIVGCPYEGFVSPDATAKVARQLYEMGCYEISLGDTIGVGTPGSLVPLVNEVKKSVPVEKIAIHCHDTYGQALANILAVMQVGVQIVDCSVGGLGGCPYARGASGNVASEDVVYLLAGLGVKTDVSLAKLVDAGNFICKAVGKKNGSKVAAATGGCQ